MIDLIRNSDTHSISVYYRGKTGFDNATASASRLPTYWWVDRVFVHKTLRRKGMGKLLVGELLKLIRTRGFCLVQVAPGGYGMEYEDQRSFYESCGFCETEPGLMELKLRAASKGMSDELRRLDP